MEYITSRGFSIPTNQKEMEQSNWFNMWKRKNFPYSELLAGDILYWYETKTQKLVWKTIISSVERYPYANKKNVFEKYENPYGSNYYPSRPERGYFVGYKVKVIERLDISKPKGFIFPQLGWLKVSEKVALDWFKRNNIEEDITLDEIVDLKNESITKLLAEIDKKMQNVSAERIKKVVSATIRKDTKIIKTLKKVAGFKCQFPNCGHQIKKKTGGYYIEVAHIKPVKQDGKSILGNLIVLCPNHHKEFDYGNLSIKLQTLNKIAGSLNEKEFEIELISI